MRCGSSFPSAGEGPGLQNNGSLCPQFDLTCITGTGERNQATSCFLMLHHPTPGACPSTSTQPGSEQVLSPESHQAGNAASQPPARKAPGDDLVPGGSCGANFGRENFLRWVNSRRSHLTVPPVAPMDLRACRGQQAQHRGTAAVQEPRAGLRAVRLLQSSDVGVHTVGCCPWSALSPHHVLKPKDHTRSSAGVTPARRRGTAPTRLPHLMLKEPPVTSVGRCHPSSSSPGPTAGAPGTHSPQQTPQRAERSSHRSAGGRIRRTG